MSVLQFRTPRRGVAFGGFFLTPRGKRDVRREKLRRVRKQLGKDLICLHNESGMSWDELYNNYHITEAKMRHIESGKFHSIDIAYLVYLAWIYHKEIKIEFV